MLPVGGERFDWPPKAWANVFARYKEHEAWFSGSPNKLMGVYYGGGSRPAGWFRTNFDRFWARSPAPQTRLMLHEPIAGTLCSVNSDLLFAVPPDIRISPEDEAADPLQARLDEILTGSAAIRSFTELAETVTAFGGGYLRVAWDKDFEPRWPFLDPVDADQAIPEFRWNRLTAVTFWAEVAIETASRKKQVWRHLERHEPGLILTGLYRGDQAYLGVPQPLDALPELVLGEPAVETKVEGLTAVYIPNLRPNRLFRGSLKALGRSDFDGLEAELDALDEAATSLMRDLRLARARLIVPGDLLESRGKGQGSKFDLDQEVWEGAPSGMPTFGSDNLITPSQFMIRADDHLKILKSKLETIINAAGYSVTTFGLEMPRSVPATATEIVNRERQSFVTRGKKVGYWQPALEEILETLLDIDQAQGFADHTVSRPIVDFAASIRDDPQQNAAVVHVLRSAEAASTEVRVRMVHPKWTDQEVDAEVEKILDELIKPAASTTTLALEQAPQPMPGMGQGVPGGQGPEIPPGTMAANPPQGE